MNLTEPHCGTDLGLLKTKAVPQADGSYKITGQKIFISAGEHDMSENIIHLVLNLVSCGAIEHKMGIHGNCTCVMNYDEAEGYLIGEENKGLRVMFVMMNRARLDVGMQGFALSEVAYQNAAAYAKDRLQGRSLTGPKNENGAADPLIVHPDVRRMLMETRAYNEGARALVYWAAMMEDIEHATDDEAVQEKCDDLLGLLTPVILIYEGANGVQALDLVGRKLARNDVIKCGNRRIPRRT